MVEYRERTAALRREILDVVSLADSAAKLPSVEHRSKERRMRISSATRDGIQARSGRPRSGRSKGLEPWPER
jgi:hypothetical protein